MCVGNVGAMTMAEGVEVEIHVFLSSFDISLNLLSVKI